MKLIFATQNQHKLSEAQHLIGNVVQIISLSDLNFFGELPETHFTLEENAEEKAAFVTHHFKTDCFADDTGLEIEWLNGAPGVFSARYAGDQKTAEENIRLVLEKMQGAKNRKAKFRTVIHLILKNENFLFEGSVNGIIADEVKGSSGFGYDSIFIPSGFSQTFAEMDFNFKNEISHRKNAILKMKIFLEKFVKEKIDNNSLLFM